MVQCYRGDHAPEIYYEAVITGGGTTEGIDGYACHAHEPSWRTLQQGLADGQEVLQFRTKALADTKHWTRGEVLDEYDPAHMGWGDDD